MAPARKSNDSSADLHSLFHSFTVLLYKYNKLKIYRNRLRALKIRWSQGRVGSTPSSGTTLPFRRGLPVKASFQFRFFLGWSANNAAGMETLGGDSNSLHFSAGRQSFSAAARGVALWH